MKDKNLLKFSLISSKVELTNELMSGSIPGINIETATYEEINTKIVFVLNTLDFHGYIRDNLIKGASAIFYLFDLNDSNSFTNVVKIISDYPLPEPDKKLSIRLLYLVGIKTADTLIDQTKFKDFASENNLRYSVIPKIKFEHNKDLFPKVAQEIITRLEK